jgi:hypothetical protein
MVAIIGAATSLSFALVAVRCLGVLAVTPGHFKLFSLIFAVIAVWFSYQAVRATTSGQTDEASILRGFEGAIIGAFAGISIVAVAFAMFAQTARAYFAHPLGLYFSEVTMFRLLIAFVWLGFGAGFVLRIPKLRER